MVAAIVLSSFAVIGIGLFLFFRSLMRAQLAESRAAMAKMAEVLERMTRARPAEAKVTRVHLRHGAVHLRTEAIADLDLEVGAPDGSSYAARSSWKVELTYLSRLQAGQSVHVRVDADDRAAVYPGEEWAGPWPY